jgi:hypothetical protein
MNLVKELVEKDDHENLKKWMEKANSLHEIL